MDPNPSNGRIGFEKVSPLARPVQVVASKRYEAD